MINWNTIISSFNDKGTLLKWLKKLEKALEEGSLENAEIISVDETHKQIKFIFADGSSITSDPIELARGPEGPQGEDGDDGESATVTIGTVTTLQPNQQAYVTNTGTTTDAIFNFGIPKGETGSATAQEITNIDIADVITNVEYDTTDGIQIESEGVVTYSDSSTNEVVNTYNIPIKPISGELVMDKAEDEEFVEIGVDQAITNKVNRALLTPLTTPTENELVGINTSNAQTRITIGNNLSLVNNELNATGGFSLTKLWENADPSSSFSAQDVTISSISNYKLIMIRFNVSTTSARYVTIILDSNDLTSSSQYISSTGGKYYINTRVFSESSQTTGINFATARKSTEDIGSYTNDDSVNIPYQVWGIK